MDFPERITAMQPFWGVWMLDSLLGEGSYGKVYRIKREEMGETTYAALKWISLPKSATELEEYRTENLTDEDLRALYRETVRQFREEIVLMNKLRGNSHVVNYEDHLIAERSDEIGWEILIRMELLTPLNKRFRDGMTVGDVVKLGLDLCDGLALCAKAKIIHRDIKSDNIFVSPYGEFKLGDFGVARSMERAATHLSRQGTPLYMAPEVYLNTGVYDATVDLYSLALVMHRLLNRQRLPFLPMSDTVPTHAERNAALDTRLSGVPLPPPVDGGVELAKVICKAAAFDPRKRYQSPEQMQSALQAAAARTNLKQRLTANPTGAGLNSGRSSLNRAVPEASAQNRRKVAEAAVAGMARETQPVRRKNRRGWRNALVGVVVTLALGSIGLGLWMNQTGQPFPFTATNPPAGWQGVTEGVSAPLADNARPTASKELTNVTAQSAAPVSTIPQTPTPARASATVNPSAATVPPQADAHNMATIQNSVRKALGLSEGTPVTDSMAATVTELDLQNCGLTDIGYLQKCTGLVNLNLSDNQISDLTPLSALSKLTVLRLWNNAVTSINPIAGLTRLQTLDLGKNKLSDVTVLIGMTKMQWLGLSYNALTRIAPLSRMTNLTFLGIGYNQISDISPLSNLPQLEELWLVGNQIRDVKALSKLRLLRKLSLAENPVEDYTPLTGLKRLTDCDMAEKVAAAAVEKAVRAALRISENQEITDEYAASVRSLPLDQKGLTDISYLSKFTGLRSLSLNNNQITDITPLSQMTSLSYLSIYLNGIKDISPLQNMTNLVTLDLGDNDVMDLTPLKNMTHLSVLWMGNNAVSDISPLKGLAVLKELYLYGNAIRDVSPLQGSTQLQKLSLAGNPIEDYSPLAGLDQLTTCDVESRIPPAPTPQKPNVAIPTPTPSPVPNDTAAPQINAIQCDPATVEAPAKVHITADLQDDVGIRSAEVTLLLGGQYIMSTQMSYNQNSSQWEGTLSIHQTIREGSFHLQITAKDRSGHETTRTFRYQLKITNPNQDTVAPVVDSISVDPKLVQPDAMVKITANITDNLQRVTYVDCFLLYDDIVKDNVAMTNIGNGQWFCSFRLKKTANLGKYRVRVYAEDNNGNHVNKEYFNLLEIVAPTPTK